MTRRIRESDRVYPVDRASDRKEGSGRGHSLQAGGIRDAWLKDIRTPSADERAAAARYLTRAGHADLLDVLGLAS